MKNVKRGMTALLAVGALLLGAACAAKTPSDYAVKAVPLTAVKLTQGFWAQRQQTDVAVTIAHEMKECEDTGRIKNFELAAAALKGAKDGKFATGMPSTIRTFIKSSRPPPMSLMLKPNPELENALDAWIAKIAAAQEPDGYLYTARTINPARTRPACRARSAGSTSRTATSSTSWAICTRRPWPTTRRRENEISWTSPSKAPTSSSRPSGPGKTSSSSSRATRRSRSAWSSSTG